MAWAAAVIQGILSGGRYALFACGLPLMVGVMRVVNLAHGDLAIVAGYIGAGVVAAVQMPFLWSVPIVVLAMAALGYVLQRTVIQGSLSRGELTTLIVTFGLSIVIENGLRQFFTSDSRGLAVGDDREAAQLSGARTTGTCSASPPRSRSARWRWPACPTGRPRRSTPTTGADTILPLAFAAVVIGGLGSLWGTLIGGVVLGLAQQIGAQITISREQLGGGVFLLVLVVWPRGLTSRRAQP